MFFSLTSCLLFLLYFYIAIFPPFSFFDIKMLPLLFDMENGCVKFYSFK